MQKGLAFEEELGVELRKLGCMATQCDQWDRFEKVDFFISRIEGKRLWPPVEVQVTLQCDNLLKLAAYLRMYRGSARMAVPLYIEVEEGVEAAVAAAAVRRQAEEVVTKPSGKAPGVHAVRIAKDGTVHPFDPKQKALDLRALANPVESGSMRALGTVIDVRDSGFIVMTEDHGALWAYSGDVADLRLRQRLRDHREGERSAYAIRVSYIPSGEGRPFKRAKSVVCAPPERPILPSIY